MSERLHLVAASAPEVLPPPQCEGCGSERIYRYDVEDAALCRQCWLIEETWPA